MSKVSAEIQLFEYLKKMGRRDNFNFTVESRVLIVKILKVSVNNILEKNVLK